jgi:uncharacterized protein (TIGR02996 family)
MSDDEALLYAMICSPGDATARLIYSDWLEERGDPRAELLRTDWETPRISFVDSIAQAGHLEYFLKKYPELRENEHIANKQWREMVSELRSKVDPNWLAVVDSLGRPFCPFYFWNNTGPRAFQEGELPFREAIGARGRVITFASSFLGDAALQPGLAQDVSFLCQLQLPGCAYGAASCPAHPFIGDLNVASRQLTGTQVLQALRASDFRSEHIHTLDSLAIPFPGYQPHTNNDEIHNDPAQQYLLPRPDDPGNGEAPDELASRNDAVHEALRNAVVDGVLWYVLLHSHVEAPTDEMDRRPWVVLFAVGRSRRGDRLIGVVSHQLCHNLCD